MIDMVILLLMSDDSPLSTLVIYEQSLHGRKEEEYSLTCFAHIA